MNLLDEKDLKALRAELRTKGTVELALYLTETLNVLMTRLSNMESNGQKEILVKRVPPSWTNKDCGVCNGSGYLPIGECFACHEWAAKAGHNMDERGDFHNNWLPAKPE